MVFSAHAIVVSPDDVAIIWYRYVASEEEETKRGRERIKRKEGV